MEGPPSEPSDRVPGERTVRTGYDWAHTSPMLAVLETVSDAENAGPTDLPPLDASVDPDALDALFERAPHGANGNGVRIEFSYADRGVTVESDGSVVVTPRWGSTERMPLHFVDRDGSDGWVGEDLSVSYGGSEDVAVQVESCLDGAEPDEGDVLQELMFDLYARRGVRRVERVDESEYAPRQ